MRHTCLLICTEQRSGQLLETGYMESHSIHLFVEKKKVCLHFIFFSFCFLTMEQAQDPENAVIHKQFEEACSDFQVQF